MKAVWSEHPLSRSKGSHKYLGNQLTIVTTASDTARFLPPRVSNYNGCPTETTSFQKKSQFLIQFPFMCLGNRIFLSKKVTFFVYNSSLLLLGFCQVAAAAPPAPISNLATPTEYQKN
jgi:hypothetical protein